MKKLYISLWLLLVLTAAILALTPNILKLQNSADKMLHIMMACFILLGPTILFTRKAYTYSVALLVISAGGLLEFVQYAFLDRKAEWEDFGANIIGVALGLIIGTLIRSGYRAGAKIHL